MAVVYSLVTPFGMTTTVTVSSTNDQIELANHGMRAGQGFYFLSASTTLPQVGGVDVSTDTCYYISSTDNLSGSFKVTTNSDGSGTPLDFSSTGSSVKIVGKYWAELPTTDPGNGGNYKNRYGSSPSWTVYGKLSDAATAHNAKTGVAEQESVIEIEGKWDETILSGLRVSFNNITYSLTITTIINGAVGSGYHGGKYNGGYVLKSSSTVATLYVSQYRCLVCGFQVYNSSTGNGYTNVPSNLGAVTLLMIGESTGGGGINAITTGSIIANCLAVNSVTGFVPNTYSNAAGTLLYNCMATGCSTGFGGAAAGWLASVINCVSINNTTDWGPAPTGLCQNNAGDSGETPWTTSGKTNVNTLTTSHFVNLTNPVTASTDFAYTSDSPLIDSGVELSFFESTESMAFDSVATSMLINRPAYNNGGSEAWDIGPFEFDRGYGPAPEVLTISNLTTGTRVIATRADTGTSLGTAVESSGTATISIGYSGTVNVEARNASGTLAYKPWTTQISFPGTKSVIALQEVD